MLRERFGVLGSQGLVVSVGGAGGRQARDVEVWRGTEGKHEMDVLVI